VVLEDNKREHGLHGLDGTGMSRANAVNYNVSVRPQNKRGSSSVKGQPMPNHSLKS
jgi:hypothetical protein